MFKRILVFVPVLFIALLSNAQEKAALSSQGDFQSFVDGSKATFGNSSMPTFQYKESTKGSQFLFNTWVPGVVTNKEGIEYREGFLFNYDKMTQSLYIKVKDTALAVVIDKAQLESIVLNGDTKVETLAKVPAIDKDVFYNVLTKGTKYSLYRFTKTKFIASNYETNGITSTGNLYDEYKDDYKYYVVFADGTNKEITIKSKAIKAFFAAEKEKVDTFYKNNSDMEVDEKFVQLLVAYLNQ